MTIKKSKNKIFIINLLFIALSACLVVFIKPNTNTIKYIETQYLTLLGLIGGWMFVSVFFKKFSLGSKNDNRNILVNILGINIAIGGITVLWMFGVRKLDLSRFVLFGTLIIGTLIELTFYLIIEKFSNSKTIDESLEFKKNKEKEDLCKKKHNNKNQAIETSKVSPQKTISTYLKDYIIQEVGKIAYDFINRNIDLSNNDSTILSTTTLFNVVSLPKNRLNYIANLKCVNNIRYINKFFSAINQNLNNGGIFIGCVETKNMRKKRLLNKYPPVFNIFYYTLDYIFKRVAPKFSPTKKLYFFITKGQNRVVSKAETLGRLYSCGFVVDKLQVIDNLMYFIVHKDRKPYTDQTPTYGPLIKLRRIGKNGKEFYVYKFRTMHPFSEYLQPYIYKHHNLKEGGKFQNDFRITTMGKFMRKFWLDELPMFLNFFRGDMKIVGVRPLSKHYFNLYDEDLKTLRTKVKPGLVPPFYADMPKTLKEIQESEKKYLISYIKHPFLTDWQYFWKAFFNILFKRARSA